MRALSLLFTSLPLIPVALAEAPSYINDAKYESGKYGEYPIQTYQSSDAIAPRLNRLTHHESCDDGRLTMLAPRGYHAEARKPRAVILDSKGGLIWSAGWDGQQIYNLMVQKYKGEDFLTFWAGNDAVGGHGAGKYYMLDSTYALRYTLGGANGLDGDLHDFRIMPEGTALMTVYQIVDHDLTSVGKNTKGPIWDCLIQEVDIETGELVFQWRAADHLDVSDSYRDIGSDGEPGGSAWDWFHINSIDKDLDGNYIVSSRYTHSVYKIDGKTGEVLWVLGGKVNMFKDLSGGEATNFGFQHDARWANDFTEITIFDNTADGPKSKPRGIRLAIDEDALTVKLITEYRNTHEVPAASQGSLQDLDNGNVLLGYGFTGAFAEFAHDGTPLCDSHFQPSTHFGSGGVQSYRVLKYNWRGMPSTNPDLAVAEDSLGLWRAYVSWNGATEVAQWVLQGSNDDEAVEDWPQGHEWTTLEASPRVSFETAFTLDADHPRYLRVVAVDSMANILAATRPIDVSHANVTYGVAHPNPPTNPPSTVEAQNELHELLSLLLVLAGCGVAIIGFAMRSAWRTLNYWRIERRRIHDKFGAYKPLRGDSDSDSERLSV